MDETCTKPWKSLKLVGWRGPQSVHLLVPKEDISAISKVVGVTPVEFQLKKEKEEKKEPSESENAEK